MSIQELLIFKKDTDAIGTNRGFLFQYLKTLKLWLQNYILDNDNVIYCETDDDIKDINEESMTINYSQIKCYATSFSLNSVDVKKALANFFTLYVINEDVYNGNFIFETNSTLTNTDELLTRWYQKQGVLGMKLLSECIPSIQDILVECYKDSAKGKINPLHKKIKNREEKINEGHANSKRYQEEIDKFMKEIEKINESLDNMLAIVSDTAKISNFITRVRWVFEENNVEDAINILKTEILQQLCQIEGVKHTPNLILSRLLTEVYYKSANQSIEERKLDKALLQKIIIETHEEIINNTNGVLYSVLNNKLDNMDQKLDILLERNPNTTISSYTLPFHEEEEIEEYLCHEDDLLQSNLEKKICQIGMENLEEQAVTDIATQIRCSYLLYLEELKLSGLYKEYRDIKNLEGKVRRECIRIVNRMENMTNFNPKAFWDEVQSHLENLSKEYSVLRQINIDEDIVFAQMYQIAAECPLRWNRMVK